MSNQERAALHPGQSVRIAGSGDVGIITAQRDDGYEVHTEHGRQWHAAQALTPAPVPPRLLQMAVEVLQELATAQWSGQQRSSDERREAELHARLAQHEYGAIEMRPLGFDQLWIESEPDEDSSQRGERQT